MITIRHILASQATAYVIRQRMSTSPELKYKQWLADQGASIRYNDSDGKYWLDFADEKEYLMFALRWL